MNYPTFCKLNYSYPPELLIPQTPLIWMYSKHEPLVHNSKTILEGLLQHIPLVYNFKITLEGLDPKPLMNGMRQQFLQQLQEISPIKEMRELWIQNMRHLSHFFSLLKAP